MRRWLAALIISLAMTAGCGARSTVPPGLPQEATHKEAYLSFVSLSPSGNQAVVGVGNDFVLSRRTPSGKLYQVHGDDNHSMGMGDSNGGHGGAGGDSIWLLDLRQGRAEALPVQQTAAPPAWRPEGRGFAYVGKDAGLHVYNLEKRTDRVVSPKGAQTPIGTPIWSPDGKQIAFAAEVMTRRPMRMEVFTVPAAGSAPPPRQAGQISAGAGGGLNGWHGWRWSRDGTRLVSTPRPKTQDSQTGARAWPPILDGSTLTAGPALSPDGRTRVYAGTGEGYRQTYLLALDRSSRVICKEQIADDEALQHLVWSKDGGRLLFSVSRSSDRKDGIGVLDLRQRTFHLVQNPGLEGARLVGWVRWQGESQLLAIDRTERRLLLAKTLQAPVDTLAHVQGDNSFVLDLSPEKE